MIFMDRTNSTAPKWSHVMHAEDDESALRAFARRVGAPPSAMQPMPKHNPPHLDIYGRPKARALALIESGEVPGRVFDTTRELVLHLRGLRGGTLYLPASSDRVREARSAGGAL